MNGSRLLSLALLAITVFAGTAWWLQRETATMLAGEIELLRAEQRGIARLKAENERLRAAQISTDELARLRADRAALLRLRRDIEEMQTRTTAAR